MVLSSTIKLKNTFSWVRKAYKSRKKEDERGGMAERKRHQSIGEYAEKRSENGVRREKEDGGLSYYEWCHWQVKRPTLRPVSL